MYFYSIQYFPAKNSASRNVMNKKHLFIRFDQKESIWVFPIIKLSHRREQRILIKIEKHAQNIH